MDDQPLRLSKRLSELGLCSRREADTFIAAGRVRVDGVVVDVLGTKVLRAQTVELDAAARRAQEAKATVIYNKPLGVVSGQAEDGYTAAIDLLTADCRDPRCSAGPWGRGPLPNGWRRGLAPAGRLDIDSTGLLVLTADGRVARRLIGSHQVADERAEKEYIVRVRGELDRRRHDLLRHGLELDGRLLERARIDILEPSRLRFVLREGRKRQIRRMCVAVGLDVLALRRIRIGNVRLADLAPGMWRFLRSDEQF